VAKPEIRGSVYRIRRIGARAADDARGARLDLAAMPSGKIAKLMADDRPAVRDRAVELLVERGEGAVADLSAVRAASPSYETRAAAVFALFRIGTAEAKAAVRAGLDDADFRVRLAAARCAGMAGDRKAAARLQAMARKDQPAARRQAIAALGQMGETGAVMALLEAAANPEDRFVEHSVIYSLIELRQAEPLRRALDDPRWRVRKAALVALDQMDGSPLQSDQAVRLLRASDRDTRAAALWVVSHHPEWADTVLTYLEERLHDPAATLRERDSLRDALLAFSGNPAAQQLVARLLADAKLGEGQILFLLEAIDASPVKQFPDAWMQPLAGLLGSARPEVRMRAVDLIRARGLPGFDAQLQAISRDRAASDQLRASALGVLVARDARLAPEQYAYLVSRLAPDSDAVLRQTAARVIGRSAPGRNELLDLARRQLGRADPLTLSTVLECFRTSHDEAVGEALVAVLRSSPAAAGTLGEDRVKALLAGDPESVRQAAQPMYRQLREGQRERIERLRRLEPLLTGGGDVGRGRRIFFGQKVACSSCHTIGAEGGHVGPDLTGVGAIRSGHDLLEAIVFPSASFVPGFEIFLVDLGNDRLSGVLRSQSREAVVLVTGPHGEVRIPRAQIKSMERSTVSLMPDGFDESLTRQELTDLLAYLQAEKTRPQAAMTARLDAR